LTPHPDRTSRSGNRTDTLARGPDPSGFRARPVLLVLLFLALIAQIGAGAETHDPAAPVSSGKGLVNMEFRDTELPTVLRTICQGAGLDFVLDPSVKGKVTAKLKNTSWEDALEIILKSHGLAAKRQGNTILVTPDVSGASAASRAKERRVTVTPGPDGTFNLDASGAEIRETLRELATAAGMNIVAAKDLSGSITASLRGLRARDLLLALADSCNAAVTEKENVILFAPQQADAAGGTGVRASDNSPNAKATVKVERLAEGRLAIHAENADIRSLLRQVSETSGLNIVASPKLSESVSLHLNNVSTQDALAAIATQAGITFKPLGNIMYAVPVIAPIQTEAFRLRYADAKEVSEALRQALPEAKIAIETANNLVIVTGPPGSVAIARQIVERVEVAPVQVTIETRIIETNMTDDQRLGIEWSDSIGVSATTPEIPHTWPLRRTSKSKSLPSYDPGSTRSAGDRGVPHADPDDFKFGFLTSTGLSMVLNMLQQETSTRTIANPLVTTVENQTARISMVTKFPIATYQVSQDTGVLTVSGFEYKEFGTILEVSPRVSDGYIILKVHPEISRQAGTTQFQGAELPIIASQETDTEVRVRDGDTLVIAGLIREDTENRKRGVPYLSKIPLIGGLFRSRRSRTDERRNLLIFITPHIVGDADFARAAELKRKRTEPLPGAEEGNEP